MATDTVSNSESSSKCPVEFVKVLLRGAGQVMFQNSIWTGLFFLVGIFVGAYLSGQPLVAWGAVVGLIVSTVAGYILPLPKDEGNSGLWGFNGILVGCAFFTFLGNTPFTWVALILCAISTTWVRAAFNNVLLGWKVNSLTFPFVFMTWIFLFCGRLMLGMPADALSNPQLMTHVVASGQIGFVDLVIYWLEGISQVFLINSWITGLLFLIGLYLSNKWAAIWAAVGSAIALAFALAFEIPGSDISSGLYGFSATLTGIALGMTFYTVNWKSAIWAVLGIVFTVFIQVGMNALLLPFGIPSLTAPFCIATWLFLLPLFKFDTTTDEVNHSHWHKKKLNP